MRIKCILVFLSTLIFLFNNVQLARASSPQKPQDIRVEAVVTKIIEKSTIIEESGNQHLYQKLLLIGTSGQFKGKNLQVENGKYDSKSIIEYKVGDKVVLNAASSPSGQYNFTITDYVRRAPLIFLFVIFVALALIIGGKRGFSSLLGMGITFAILFAFVLPLVLRGVAPVFATILASFIIIPITFSLSHGVNKKTLSAIAATFISLLLTGLLAYFFVDASHLTGFASEEASYLNVTENGAIDIHGLLLAGLIIGLLGILQDITISQAAVVCQLKNTDHKLKFDELFSRAMDVGRDHIASMSNTLILVYAGVSLPLLLLFLTNPLPFSAVINFEMIAEEIVRTLISSIGLILAVPITTALTAFVVSYHSQK